MATSDQRRRLRARGAHTDTPSRARGLKRITPHSHLYWVRLLLENPVAVVSLFYLLTLIAVSLLLPVFSDVDPSRTDPAVRLQGPSQEFLMGTDQLGRDVLLRAIYGARVSLAVGASIMVITACIGTLIGLVSGYFPRADTPIMRVMDGIMAFPPVLLAIAIMASLGQSTLNVVVALGIVYIPEIARLARGSTLSVKRQPFVEAARAIGETEFRVLLRHIFPNVLSPLIVQSTFIVALAIIAEASLSFLGAGVPVETPTWGAMLQEGYLVMRQAWWMVLTPGAFLFLTVLALNLIGDALRDALDPRFRDR